MICAPGLVFYGTERVGSRFHVLRARTSFRWYRGRRFTFSCFALPNSFSAVPRASCPFSCFAPADSFSTVPRESGPVFTFCAPGLIFGGTECVASRFHVLRDRTRFRRYRGRQVLFSFFAFPDSLSAVPRASGPFFKLCAHGLVFYGNEGVRSLIHVLRARTHFRRYRGRRIPF
jgi:hypothetical protein